MSEKLFSKKIQYLYNNLKIKDKEFTKLFWNGEQKKLASRNTTVHKSWLGTKGIEQVKGFYFDDYPISKYKIGDKKAFTKDLFMIDSFELFKQQVDAYIYFKNKPKKLFEYKYVYYYDKRKNQICSSELIVLSEIREQTYKVELLPLNSSSDKELELYQGELQINSEYYHLSIRNSFEILTLYFVVGRGYGKKKKVNGIGLGLTYDSGLPQATKELMTKKRLSKDEEKDFYLIANEMEYIRSDESLTNLNSDKKMDYLNQLYKRINDLGNYTNKANNILKDRLFDDIYFTIFHEILNRFYEISQKVETKQDFHVFRRRNSIEIFLNTIAKRENSFCTIVYPLFGNDIDLFDKGEEYNTPRKTNNF